MLTQNKTHRVVIIGGGPAGSTCAIALAHLGIKDILIVESSRYDTFRIGESVPPEIHPLLNQLGIFNKFLAQSHEPCYGTCSYWGDDRRGYNDSIMSVYGHGWHLNRRLFNQLLAEEAQNLGIQLFMGMTFIKSEQLKNHTYRLSIKDAQKKVFCVDTDFVVDASGTRSIFAFHQGSRQVHKRPLITLAVRFYLDKTSTSITKMTQIEATKDGWWYAAHLPNNLLLLTFTTDVESFKKKHLRHMSHYLTLLENSVHTKNILRHTKAFDIKPKCYPASSFILDNVIGPHWLAIGDAASAYDPIMSQGIIKAMSNAQFAANMIQRILNHQQWNVHSYKHMISKHYLEYTHLRKTLYQLEKRWVHFPFWIKQHTEC